jgi:competence protein ComFC
MSLLAPLLDPFLTLLYPPRCLVCKTLGEAALCTTCAAQIIPIPVPYCVTCGHPQEAPSHCTHCAARHPAYTRARALGAYDGVLRQAIHQFKYRDRPQLAVPLGGLLADYAQTHAVELNGLRFDALLPVPMHAARKRQRGYNQSERLAHVLSTELSLPLVTDALIRPQPSRPQVGLTGEARRTNLRGAFTVKHAEAVAGKTLLLIDDVATSGSSLHECALALKSAGANAVYALTLAAG